MTQCNLCFEAAALTFAQVPLCHRHYNRIWKETMQYYTPRKGRGRRETKDGYYRNRPEYHKISRLIPWARVGEK